MEKQEVLDNVDSLSAEDIARYIGEGTVSFEELQKTGDFAKSKQKQVKNLLEQAAQSEEQESPRGGEVYLITDDEEAWHHACTEDTEESYRQYLRVMEDGVHRDEARERMWAKQSLDEPEDEESVDEDEDFFKRDFNEILEEIREIPLKTDILNEINEKTVDTLTGAFETGEISKRDILGQIEKDKNWLNPVMVRSLIEKGVFSYKELNGIGFDKIVLKKIKDGVESQAFSFPSGRKIAVSRPSYEVYFWGIPSSGKTCALGGILSMANTGRIARGMQVHSCQGSDYLAKLRGNFKENEICVLPGGTPVDATYVMEFDLLDQKEKEHPITFIDLAGEILYCMYNKYNHKSLTSDQQAALDNVTALLSNSPKDYRKIHFFVVDYGGEQKRYNGIDQKTYLEFAMLYIRQTGIFDRNTDAIYILMTKADLIQGDQQQGCRKFLEENYAAFVQEMQNLCRRNEINGGRIDVFPFTIGKVMLKTFCQFSGEASGRVLEKILDRTQGKSDSKLTKWLKL